MAKLKDIENDLLKRSGAVLSAADIVKYSGLGRETVRKMLLELAPISNGYKCYFYQDVAKIIHRRTAL